MTLSGPPDVWFGVGLNASTMADEPYTIVLDGAGKVSERKLADQSPGKPLSSSITVVSNTVVGEGASRKRVVELTRPLVGATPEHLSFSTHTTSMEFIMAIGSGPSFAYHKAHSADILQFWAVGNHAPTCVCMNHIDQPFGKGVGVLHYAAGKGEYASGVDGSVNLRKGCKPEPFSDMLKNKNPACDVRSYVGGQSCAHHLWSLLDASQPIPWRDQPLVYQFKWRIYFKEYTPPLASFRSSPQVIENIQDYAYGGLATPTEYTVPRCAPGTATKDCIHEIHGSFQLKDFNEKSDDMPMGKGNAMKIIKINGHCHAPTCLSFDLFNNDTGELICHQAPLFGGAGAPTVNGTRFDEPGYIK
jgi:hypothetical protein